MQESPQKKVFNFSLFKRIFRFVKPYAGFFYGSILLAIVMAFFAPVRPYLIQLTIDSATGKALHLPAWVK